MDHVVQSIDSDVKWASGREAKAKRTSCTSSLTLHGLPVKEKQPGGALLVTRRITPGYKFDSLEKNTPLPSEPPMFSQEVQVKRFALFMGGEELLAQLCIF